MRGLAEIKGIVTVISQCYFGSFLSDKELTALCETADAWRQNVFAQQHNPSAPYLFLVEFGLRVAVVICPDIFQAHVWICFFCVGPLPMICPQKHFTNAYIKKYVLNVPDLKWDAAMG